MIELYINTAFLVVGTFFDIKKKQLPKLYLFVWLVFDAIWLGLDWQSLVLNRLIICLLPGMIMLVLAFLTKEQLGYGDGMVLILMGCLQEMRSLCVVLLYAFFGAACVSGILCLFKKANRKTKLPFLPFLFLTQLIYAVFQATK